MTLADFNRATRFLAEERLGAAIRAMQIEKRAEEDAAFAASSDALRQRDLRRVG